MAVIASSLFCALAYLNVASSSAVVFNWVSSIIFERLKLELTLQIVRQPHKHLRIYQLDLLRNRLPPLPQSLHGPRHHLRSITLPLQDPAFRELFRDGILFLPAANQRLHRLLAAELVRIGIPDRLCGNPSLLGFLCWSPHLRLE